jgi:hypothetical protein
MMRLVVVATNFTFYFFKNFWHNTTMIKNNLNKYVTSLTIIIALLMVLSFTCSPATMAQAATTTTTTTNPINATFTLSAQPPYTVGQAFNLVATITNTLPASTAAVPAVSVTLTGTVTYSIAGGIMQTLPVNQLLTTIPLVPAVNNLASNIIITTTVPTTLLTVGTVLPTGVSYVTSSGLLTIAPTLTLDGGANTTYTIPVTFR